MTVSISKQREVDRFNEACPVGTTVRYWKGVREGEGAVGVTTHPATVLGGHTAVAWIDTCSGCVSLTHVEGVPDE